MAIAAPKSTVPAKNRRRCRDQGWLGCETALSELQRQILRLEKRDTENKRTLDERIERAKTELTYENNFDKVLINDKLDLALEEAEEIVRNFFSPLPKKKKAESRNESQIT